MTDLERDLRTLLRDQADDVEVPRAIPERTIVRSRRRRTGFVVVSGIVALAMLGGSFAVTQAVRNRRPPAPAGVPRSGEFPGIWPHTSWERFEAHRRSVTRGDRPWLLDPVETARGFAEQVFHHEDFAVELMQAPENGRASVEVTVPLIRGSLTTTIELRELASAGGPAIWTVISARTRAIDLRSPDRGDAIDSQSLRFLGTVRRPGLTGNRRLDLQVMAGPTVAGAERWMVSLLMLPGFSNDFDLPLQTRQQPLIVLARLHVGSQGAAFEAFRLTEADTVSPLPEPSALVETPPLTPGEGVLQILNGTNRPGLASQWASRLKKYGYTIGDLGNAARPYARTAFFYRADSKDLARQLAVRYFPNATVQQTEANLDPEIRVTMVLGPDAATDPVYWDLRAFVGAFTDARMSADRDADAFLSNRAREDYSSGKDGIWLYSDREVRFMFEPTKELTSGPDIYLVAVSITEVGDGCETTFGEELTVRPLPKPNQGLDFRIERANWHAEAETTCA